MSVELRRTNIPPQADVFIGRGRTLQKLRRGFKQGARVVTIIGAEGAGKSRLALRYASQYLNDWVKHGGAGAWHIVAPDLDDVESILRVVNETLNIEVPADLADDPVAAIGGVLDRMGQVLIVLDGVDGIPQEELANVLSRWRTRCPDARFLVTRRDTLGLDDEVVVQVGALRTPGRDERDPAVLEASEAVRLFLERTRAVLRGYTADGKDLVAISTIVRRLGGLPLAIELAAARMQSLTPGELLERLPRDVSLLQKPREKKGGRHPESRRVSLSNTIDWSWKLLQPWEQDALAQASVFRGGFDDLAANAVIDLSRHEEPPLVNDALQSLIGKSLLRAALADGFMREVRFSHYGPVRDFAEDHLREAGQIAAYDRHAQYFVEVGRGWLQRVDGPEGQLCRRRLYAEHENILEVHRRALRATQATRDQICQALEAALILEPQLATRGPFAMHLELLDAALSPAKEAGVPMSLLARAHESRGRARRARGLMQESLQDLEQALHLAREAKEPVLEGRALGNVGTHYLYVGDTRRAALLYEQALVLLRNADDHTGMSRVLVGRCLAFYALVHQEEGRLDEAHRCFDEALEILRKVGDRRHEAITRGNFGTMLFKKGRIDDARRELRRALGVHRSLHNRVYEGRVLSQLANLDLEVSRVDDARRNLEDALAIHREVFDRRGEGVVLAHLGDLALDEGNTARAREAYEAAQALCKDVGHVRAV